MVLKKINKIKKADFNRALITETLPYETPIIFASEGIYERISKLNISNQFENSLVRAIVFGEGLQKAVNSTIPYSYKIRRNSVDYRRLSLLHPMSQWQIRCFYEKYQQLMLHFCSFSRASIRSPNSVAGSFYNKSSWANIYQYKNDAVATTVSDKFAKHTPSFFAYRGYDRLYKFFNSRDFFNLEKRYRVLQTLDVTKCFDSIYTHCISWAVKDKEFTKQHLSVVITFPQEFDRVIRHGNHNETNGIPIGPEVSRIYAEIILQEIDQRVIRKIQDLKKWEFNIDYTFRRYVDDVYIFADSEEAAKIVYEAYADCLIGFNLHANFAKSTRTPRPFQTVKSRLVSEASERTNKFIDHFIDQTGRDSLVPKKIFSSWQLTKSYIDSIKSLCAGSQVNYDEIASFLVSVLTERVKKLVNSDLTESNEGEQSNYLEAAKVLLDVMYFFYDVSPSVGASYKLATAVILLIRFFRQRIPNYGDTISQHIYDLTENLLVDEIRDGNENLVDDFISLEAINVVLAVRELGENYLFPLKTIERLFFKNENISYFTIISCLFYIKDTVQYQNLRERMLRQVDKLLNNLSDVFSDSQKAYLLLDMLSCPGVSNTSKARWINAIYGLLGKPQPLPAQVQMDIQAVEATSWQVNWAEVDLLNSLEKKELKQAY